MIFFVLHNQEYIVFFKKSQEKILKKEKSWLLNTEISFEKFEDTSYPNLSTIL